MRSLKEVRQRTHCTRMLVMAEREFSYGGGVGGVGVMTNEELCL